jgi:hypothetical protein
MTGRGQTVLSWQRSVYRRGGPMAEGERPKNRVGRVANEVYVGALVLGVVVVLAGVVAAIVAGVMQVSRWVALGN